ncbi:MAG: hypothetical protein R2771_00335 [Saprospiraceae bacterium]
MDAGYTYDWDISRGDEAIIEDLIKGSYAVNVTDANECSVLSSIIKVTNCNQEDCFTRYIGSDS